MKVDVSFADGDLKKSCPLTKSEIAAVIRASWKGLRGLAELENALNGLGPKPTAVNLRFCDDIEMRAIQKRFRKLDRTTDILSFPSLELPAAQRLAAAGSLGDLLVSLPAIERGARRGRRSPKLELTEVLVHGVLHLIGMDHVQGGARAKRMRKIQKGLFLSAKAFI